MNEFLLLAVVVIYLAISEAMKNYFKFSGAETAIALTDYRLLRTKENSLWKDT